MERKEIKNVVVFYRTITERRQKGFFQEVCQSEASTNMTKKQIEKRLNTLNKGLRVLYSVKEYNVSTKKGYSQFLIELANNYTRTIDSYIEYDSIETAFLK